MLSYLQLVLVGEGFPEPIGSLTIVNENSDEISVGFRKLSKDLIFAPRC